MYTLLRSLPKAYTQRRDDADPGPLLRLVPATQDTLRSTETMCQLRQSTGRVPSSSLADSAAESKEATGTLLDSAVEEV